MMNWNDKAIRYLVEGAMACAGSAVAKLSDGHKDEAIFFFVLSVLMCLGAAGRDISLRRWRRGSL